MNRLDLPYQKTGAAFLAARKHALLADEPGLGKTMQVIIAADKLKVTRILVVCPAVAREVWRREFTDYSVYEHTINVMDKPTSKPQYGVNIISYDRAAKETMLKTLMLMPWDLLILDEGHYLKKTTTARTKAAYGYGKRIGLAHAAKRTWVLTGTPSPNNPFELYPHIRTLFGEHFKMRDGRPMTAESFKNRYCVVKHNGFGEQIVGARNLSELKQRLQPHFLRRKKDDVLDDLPPVFTSPLYVDGHSTLAEWKELLKLDEMIGFSERIVRAKNDKARMAVLNSIDDSLKRRIRQLTGIAKTPAVIAWLKDQIESGTQKIVVFAYHKEVIRQLSKAFPGSVVLAGGATDKTRREAEQKFQTGKMPLFIGQLQAAGVAITLTAASTVLFAEYSWTPGDNEQCADRIRRIGQKDTCFVRYAILSDSLDERILAVIQRKMTDIRKIFN